MKYYEFKLKIYQGRIDGWVQKYRCVVEEERYIYTKKKFEEQASKDPENCLVLINELDENKEFVQIIQ